MTMYWRIRFTSEGPGSVFADAAGNSGTGGSGTDRIIHTAIAIPPDASFTTSGPWALLDSEPSALFQKHLHLGSSSATIHEIHEFSQSTLGPWTVGADRTIAWSGPDPYFPRDAVDVPALEPSGVCAYGTEQKPGEAGVIDVAGALINFAIKNPVYRWIATLAGVTVVRPWTLSVLCAQPPPPDEDIVLSDFIPTHAMPVATEAQRKAGVKFYRYVWDQYCQCTPAPAGSPAPVGPGTTNFIQPTYYITYDNDVINNYDIGPILNIYNTFTSGNTYITNETNALSTFPTNCVPPGWDESTVHEGVVGEGRFDVSNVVGFKVEVTSRDPGGLVLEGQPAYLWNMGWISILADELLLEEKRVTRSGYLWFPCPIKHATQFTFTMRTGVEMRVTELVTPAAIVLAG